MKVCWFGIYDEHYSRNNILIEGLRANGVEVILCNTKKRGLHKYFDIMKKLYQLKNNYDILYCAFPVNYNVLIAKVFQNKPIVVDAFFSLHEATVVDRKIISALNPISLIYYSLDWINVNFANIVIVDTEENGKFWKKFSSIDVYVIPVGTNTNEFFPIMNERKTEGCYIVTFHGSYIPLQGITKIVGAANILKNRKNIKFRFIGKGQLYVSIKKQLKDLDLDVELIPWLKVEDLNIMLNESDIILGIFGDTDKTNRVVPNKVYQGVAVKNQS